MPESIIGKENDSKGICPWKKQEPNQTGDDHFSP